MVNSQQKRMVKKEVKTGLDAPHVFTNGSNKEAKEQTTSKPTNSGFIAEEQSQKSAPISMFLIQS